MTNLPLNIKIKFKFIPKVKIKCTSRRSFLNCSIKKTSQYTSKTISTLHTYSFAEFTFISFILTNSTQGRIKSLLLKIKLIMYFKI